MNKDLTQGAPHTVLWQYTLPLFVSVIFQQLYNIADSVIAGKFAGESALAAVGASYPITMILMAIAVGSNVGCSVVISRLFGARDFKAMKTAVSTTMIASLVLSLVLTVLGLAGTPALMHMLNTPEDIFADGSLYLAIYVGGFTFLFLYNVTTGIFSAMGDSKTPLYFLIGSSVGNIVLDYIFVRYFSWGVAGVAWATFIAQGVACVLALITLQFRIGRIQVEGHADLFSRRMLMQIARVAIPSILQQSFISVGNIFIQWLVNGFGSSVIAGYSAAVKLNTFGLTCFTTLGNGVSNFTAQNLGAGKEDRVRSGLRTGLVMAMIVCVPFVVCYTVFGGAFVGIFMENGSSGAALQTGVEFLRIVSPFYFVISVKLVADGVLRGSAAMVPFMIATFTDLILRVILAFILSGMLGSSTGIWLSWPIGWTVAMALSLYYYFHGVWRLRARTE